MYDGQRYTGVITDRDRGVQINTGGRRQEVRSFPINTKRVYNKCRTNVEEVEPTFYKCYTNVLCLLGYNCRFTLDLYFSIVIVSKINWNSSTVSYAWQVDKRGRNHIKCERVHSSQCGFVWYDVIKTCAVYEDVSAVINGHGRQMWANIPR